MRTKTYQIKGGSIQEIDVPVSALNFDDESYVYACDILCKERQAAIDLLQQLGFDLSFCNQLLSPQENLRFTYYGNVLYGELAYYSEKTKRPYYAAVIIYKNTVLNIYEEELGISKNIISSISNLSVTEVSSFSLEHVLYILVLELLSYNASIILEFRNKIEKYTRVINDDPDKVTPEFLLESKNHLSDYSMVVEQLFYTLSFPPAKEILNVNSSYKTHFNELIKSMSLLKSSLNQVDNKLESLTDHLELMQQEKSNKRLKYLTIIQAVFVPLTLVAGIYGMNFKFMPELDVEYGYFYSLGFMAIIAIATLAYFYNKKWFD